MSFLHEFGDYLFIFLVDLCEAGGQGWKRIGAEGWGGGFQDGGEVGGDESRSGVFEHMFIIKYEKGNIFQACFAQLSFL